MASIKNLLNNFDKEVDAVINYHGISNRKGYLVLFLILVLTTIFRVMTIDTPAIDRTAWKEIDYIMISKNYFQEDSHFLYPRISWLAEEARATAMELPIVPYLASWLYPLFGVNAFSVRLVTLIAFLLLIVYTFKLVLREEGMVLALLAAFFTALTPLFSPFRNFLFSEPALLFFSVFAIYQYAQWIDFNRKTNLLGFILGFSIAVSLKPTALYLILPLFWIHFRKYRFDFLKYLKFAGVLAVSMVIPVLWYWHSYYLAKNYVDVFGVFGGQFGGHNKFQTLRMLSDPSWYMTMVMRLRRLLLGFPGLLIFSFGIIIAFRKKIGGVFFAYLLAIFCFFIIVAEGQIDAPYRQLTIIPSASFFLALGTIGFAVLVYNIIMSLFSRLSEKMAMAFATISCLIFLSFLPIRRPHFILPGARDVPVHPDNWLLAEQIRKNASGNSRIIMAGEYTIHEGGNDVSPVTYYYAGLNGWTIQEGEWNHSVIDSLKMKGADLFGAIYYRTEPGLEVFIKSMTSRYEVLFEDPEKELLLLSLRSDKH